MLSKCVCQLTPRMMIQGLQLDFFHPTEALIFVLRPTPSPCSCNAGDAGEPSPSYHLIAAHSLSVASCSEPFRLCSLTVCAARRMHERVRLLRSYLYHLDFFLHTRCTQQRSDCILTHARAACLDRCRGNRRLMTAHVTARAQHSAHTGEAAAWRTKGRCRQACRQGEPRPQHS